MSEHHAPIDRASLISLLAHMPIGWLDYWGYFGLVLWLRTVICANILVLIWQKDILYRNYFTLIPD
ncbi:hypothetical protein TYRP_010582 [Tyrophagus putrescentiae]|nr:hypothetical protein TYRP_010582 [Tyrophagus putrescentiae]